VDEALLVRRGRLFDPTEGLDQIADLLVRRGVISEIGSDLHCPEAGVVEADGRLVVPGFIDMHTHLREPGDEAKETLATGTEAAAAGGFTTVCAMPNTRPPVDSPARVEELRRSADRKACVRVEVVAALSHARAGDQLAPLSAMAQVGAVAFSDDGDWLADSGLMRHALSMAAVARRPVMSHCQDASLVGAGVVHPTIARPDRGVLSWPSEGEYTACARDVMLALATGGHLHLCHLSARESVEVVRWAKDRGVSVSCEAAPHHLTLTEEDVLASDYDSDFKVNPPLRGAENRRALIEGLRDGTIDAVATDHAPHTREGKTRPFAQADFGMTQLETAFSVLYTDLVKPGLITLERLIGALTSRPADLLGLRRGRLRIGWPADLTLLDLASSWTVSPDRLLSRGKNTPYRGRKLQGRSVLVIVAGRPVPVSGSSFEGG